MTREKRDEGNCRSYGYTFHLIDCFEREVFDLQSPDKDIDLSSDEANEDKEKYWPPG